MWFSYTFLSATYSIFTEELDGIENYFEGDGLEFDLMLNATKNIAFMASYGAGSADVSGNGNIVDAEVDGFSFGILLHMPVNESTDFIGGVGRTESTVDFELNGTFLESIDSHSNSIFIGVRTWASNKLELRAIIDRSKSDDESDTDLNLSGSFYIDKTFSIDGNYFFDSEGRSIGFGITKNF